MGSSTSNMSRTMVTTPENEISVVDSDSCRKALSNSVVLRTIMNHLNVRDLVHMRLVSKKWEEEATIQLLKTQHVKPLWFSWDRAQHKFLHRVGTLQELTDICLSDPHRKFPCSQFEFYNVTTNSEITEAPVDLSRFLSKYGNHIKSFKITSLKNSASALEIIHKIIFEQAPALKSLTLDVDLYKEESSSSSKSLIPSSSKIILGHLEEFCFNSTWFSERPFNEVAAERCFLLIQEILSSAPNLKRISDPYLWLRKQITSAGKIELLDDLHMESGPESVISRFIEFSKIRPQLTNLKIELEYFDYQTLTRHRIPSNDFLSSLQLILQSSRKTLKTLQISGRMDMLVGPFRMSIPVMENLQELEIESCKVLNDGRGRLLPEGFSLQQSFPRLKVLSLEESGYVANIPATDNTLTESYNSSTTVRVLNIQPGSDNFRSNWLGQARTLYLNVRVLNLDICNHQELPTVLVNIWRSWKESQLEELSVVSAFKDKGNRWPFIDNSVPERERNQKFATRFDQALTGFTEDCCKMISGHLFYEKCEEEELQQGPSILDMKSLKLFKVDSYEDDPFPSYPIFSPVSVIHAFEPMRKRQNLRVQVNRVDLKNLLVPFYVDFSMFRT